MRPSDTKTRGGGGSGPAPLEDPESKGGSAPDLRDLVGWIGAPCDGLREGLGEPLADSTVGRERWLVFEWTDVVLRVRGGAGPEGRITSWTATLQNGRGTLREAAAPFGLWPACAPDEEAGTVQTPLVRRGLPASGTGRARTLTATVREGRITAITLFDEPPDWR